MTSAGCLWDWDDKAFLSACGGGGAQQNFKSKNDSRFFLRWTTEYTEMITEANNISFAFQCKWIIFFDMRKAHFTLQRVI